MPVKVLNVMNKALMETYNNKNLLILLLAMPE